jgi:peptide/nickel transport system permease protein
MRRLVLTRVGWMLPTFVVITALTFGMAHLAPGDPLQVSEEGTITPQALDAARRELDLDRPLVGRYVTWLSRAARGDLGHSAVDRTPVRQKIGEALPRTVLVSGLALVLACLLSVVLGVALASRSEAVWARGVSASLALASGVPSFWIAVLALLVFATPRGIELFPLQGLDSPAHVVLPVVCLAWPTVAMLTRYVRAGVASALEQDFVRAARARGLDERRVLTRHALPNALVPLVTVVGLHLPHVFAGSVVIERVFGIQGMGLLAWDAIGTRDYPVVMGVATVMAAVTLLSMLATDLAAMALDPRLAARARS